MAGLHFPITADNGSFMRALNEVTAGVRDASRQIEAEGGSIDRVISTIKGGLATLGIGLGLKELSGQIFNTRAQFEQLEIAFTTMLGSAEKADALLTQLKQTAAKTPFEMEDVVGGAKSLLAYGIEAEKVNDTLIRLGDIASGLSIPLTDLTYLYGTTMVQGRMFTQDLRQFQGRGVPIADELAKVLGIAKDKVGEAVTAGKVGAKELEQAIVGLTSEGGKFGGLMAKQSDSLKGKWENIKDTIGLMFNEMGQQTSGVMNLTLDATASIVDHWQDVIAVLGGVAAAYGSQKAILMLDSAFTAAKNDYGYNAEMTQLRALIPVKEEAANTDLEQAVASGKLTEAKAAQIAALREEAEEYIKTLALKEADAKQAVITSQANLTTALQEKARADEFVESAEEKWKAAYDSADAIAEEIAAQELETAKAIQSEAADAVATATKEAKAASSAHVAAQQNLESASTGVNTAQSAGNTAATGILTIAKEKLAVAIGKVNAALKANQIALVTGAVIALGYAVYKLATYQTDYEKSLGRLDDAIQKNQNEYIAEGYAIDRLFEKLAQAKKGTKEWEEARNAIWSKYGQYLKSLGDEKTALDDVAAAYTLVKQEAEKAAKARALNSFVESEGQTHAEKMGDLRSKALQMVEDRYGKEFRLKHTQDIIGLVEGTATPTEGFMSKMNTKDGFFGRAGNFSRLLADARIERENYQNILIEAEEKFTSTYTKSTPVSPEIKGKNLQQVYSEAAKAYNDAKNEVEKMAKNRSAYTEVEWEKAQEDLKNAKDAYEKVGGITKTPTGPTSAQLEAKEENAAGKLAYILRKQAQERLRIEQDYEYQRWQNRIDLMQEGEAKVIAQMQLDQAKEKTSLEEQKQQAIQAEIERQKAVFDAREDEKAVGNKKYAKQVFNPATDVDQAEIKAITQRYDTLYTQLLSKQGKAEQDRLRQAQESFNAYLQEFGTYQQKREAISADYDKRISEAANTGDRMMLEAQKNKSLSDLDYQQWIDSGEIAHAFGDISNLSKQAISQLISDMEQYREKVVATFDPDKIQKYEEALDNLRKAEVEDAFTAFGDMVPEYFTKRLEIQKQINDQSKIGVELAKKQNELNQRTQSQRQTVKGLAKSQGYNLSDEDLADPKKIQQIADAISSSANSGNAFSKALYSALLELLKLNNESDDLEEATDKWDGNFANLKDKLENLKGADKFNAICEAVSKAAGVIGDLAGKASEMADALGADGFGEALGYLGDAMGSVQNIASGFSKGLVNGIAAAAGEVMNWVTKLAMAGDARHQKNIEKLQDRIDTLQKSYDKLGKSVDEAYSTDASKLIEQQNTLLQQQKVLIRQQMAEEEAKKKTDPEKLKEMQDQLDEINEQIGDNEKKAKEAIIGKDIKSAIDEFSSAYAEAWENGTDAAQASAKAVKSIISSALSELLKKNIQPTAQKFYDTLAKAMEDGILTDAELANLDAIKRQMDALAASEEEQYKKIQERYKDLDELREELTDISFDSVRDNFKSLLSDMESSTEDFTNSFTDMLRNALIEGLMDNKYDALLKEWYAEFAKAMEGGELTDSERDALRQQYDAIVQQGIADRNAINSIVGGGAYSQQASEGSAWNMSQETGDELNGRFTAMVELEATNNLLVSDGNTIARQILATLQSLSGLSMTVTGNGDKETLLAIKDMIFLQTGYLENIEKYSKNLASMATDISEMKTAIKNL